MLQSQFFHSSCIIHTVIDLSQALELWVFYDTADVMSVTMQSTVSWCIFYLQSTETVSGHWIGYNLIKEILNTMC